jgi:DNA topoisomerase-3
MVLDVRQHERILLKRYLNVNTSEIKQVLPTATGIQLIGTIQNDLVKSAELTGSWEKQLKDIEKETAAAFINNMKRMVDALVYEVRRNHTRQYFACGKYSKQEVKVEKRK